jgi:hypothetical protein
MSWDEPNGRCQSRRKKQLKAGFICCVNRLATSPDINLAHSQGAAMHIVDQYVTLNDAISQLEHQARALRQVLLRCGTGQRSAHYQVVVLREVERVFKPDLLPPETVNDPGFSATAGRVALDLQPLADSPAYLPPNAPVQVDLLRYRC